MQTPHALTDLSDNRCDLDICRYMTINWGVVAFIGIEKTP
jgi:hypothetical protein